MNIKKLVLSMILVTMVFAGCDLPDENNEDSGNSDIPVTGIELYKNSTKMLCDRTVQLVPVVFPADATNQNVTWSSNDAAVAEVSPEGVVTGIASGIAHISVATDDGGFSDVCIVMVYQGATVTTAEIVISGSLYNYVMDIGGDSAKGGGEVTDEGDLPVLERGLCWNTSGTPTMEDPHQADGEGFGAFTDTEMTGLTENTIYYVRAYARNEAGVTYGGEVSFHSGYIFGSEHEGGYVYYNDGSGGGQVAAKTDQHTSHIWSNVRLHNPEFTWNLIFNGPGRTNTIVSEAYQPGHTASAAQICLDYSDGTYADWFLPSIDGLVQMCNALYNASPSVGDLLGEYWSSSSFSDTNAMRLMMTPIPTPSDFDKNTVLRVRAARSF